MLQDDYINSLNDNLNNIKPTEHLRKLIRYKGIPAKFKEAVLFRSSLLRVCLFCS